MRNVNEHDLYSVDFTRSLPPTLKDDPEINALGRAIAGQLQITAQQIRRNIIYARIDELDEQTLDILAYDLHVDWYDHSYPIEVKRQTIKDSVKIHRRLGTKYAVETALGAVFPGTRVEEWFEYGGDPYTFRVIINATENGVTAAQQAAVLERVIFYKNLRSMSAAFTLSGPGWRFGRILRRTSKRAELCSSPVLCPLRAVWKSARS